MPVFQYEAMDANGLEVKDTIEAPSEGEAQTMIREKGFYVTKIRERERKKKAKADAAAAVKYALAAKYPDAEEVDMHVFTDVKHALA